MSKAQVKRRFGKPDETTPDSWLYVNKRIRVGFEGSRLSEIVLFKRNFVTKKGIGIGSRLAAVQRAYPGAKCFLREGSAPGAPVCVLRSRFKGKRTETYFRFISRTEIAEPTARISEISVRLGCLVCRWR